MARHLFGMAFIVITMTLAIWGPLTPIAGGGVRREVVRARMSAIENLPRKGVDLFEFVHQYVLAYPGSKATYGGS